PPPAPAPPRPRHLDTIASAPPAGRPARLATLPVYPAAPAILRACRKRGPVHYRRGQQRARRLRLGPGAAPPLPHLWAAGRRLPRRTRSTAQGIEGHGPPARRGPPEGR